MKTKLAPLRVHVFQFDVTREKNRYKRGFDHGHSFSQPMVLCLKVQGFVDDHTRTPVYFTHRLEYSENTGLSNGPIFFKTKTDFFEVEKEKGETVFSSTPEIFPNAMAIVHKATERVLISEGDKLELICKTEEKTSAAGRKYLQLSHVSLARGAK